MRRRGAGRSPSSPAHFAAEEPPKGEIVVVVGPPDARRRVAEADLDRLLRGRAGAAFGQGRGGRRIGADRRAAPRRSMRAR